MLSRGNARFRGCAVGSGCGGARHARMKFLKTWRAKFRPKLSITKFWSFWVEGVFTAKCTECLKKLPKIQRMIGLKYGYFGLFAMVCFGPKSEKN